MSPEVVSKAVKAYFAAIRAMDQGNGAAVRWSGRGLSRQGRKVHFEGIDVFEVNEAGKIQTLHAYWNPAEMVAQL